MINTLGIVILIPMYDKGLVPLLRRCGRPITLLQRIGAWGRRGGAGGWRLAGRQQGWQRLEGRQAAAGCRAGVGGALQGRAGASRRGRVPLRATTPRPCPANRPRPPPPAAGWGLVVCVGSMLVASYVEWYRLQLWHGGAAPDSECLAAAAAAAAAGLDHPPCPPVPVRLSVWWQIPQYLAVGLSEVRRPAWPWRAAGAAGGQPRVAGAAGGGGERGAAASRLTCLFARGCHPPPLQVFTSIGQMELFYDQVPLGGAGQACRRLQAAAGR